jgi:hypothetical protein
MLTERKKMKKPKVAVKNVRKEKKALAEKYLMNAKGQKVYTPQNFGSVKIVYELPEAIYPVYDSDDAATIFREIWDRESMCIEQSIYVLFLGTEYNLLAWRKLATGAFGQCRPNADLVAGITRAIGASYVILAMNYSVVSGAGGTHQ